MLHMVTFTINIPHTCSHIYQHHGSYGYDVGIEPHHFGNTKQFPMPSHGMLRVPDLRVHPPSSSIAQPADGCKDLKTFIRKPFKNYGNHICLTPVQTWGNGLKRQIYDI